MAILCVECDEPAAVEEYSSAGADELIFACSGHAFTSLKGYTVSGLQETAAKVHESGMRMSVLFNRLFGESEKEEMQETLGNLLQSDIDAVLFADPACLQTARRMKCAHKMIYRPETLLTNSRDGKWWMSLGLQSAVISPLLTREEILKIAAGVPHLTLPVHGHLLMSVSRRHLLSSWCKEDGLADLHARRDLYIIEEKRSGHMPVYESDYGTMIFTDFIQESFEEADTFVQAGIERLEIDTDFLDQENIKDTVNIYHSLIHHQPVDLNAYKEKYKLPFSKGYFGEKTIK